ncbi:hypothetical protein DFO70_108102 [Cytobacillus firmus]|uniref:SCP2 domain-containing protein n=2 Tax=Cytobacillus TaxID=2675230 RepID=A0A366JRX3_CYTFI|nr:MULTISPECIES: hypothetical protein [Cytobacillus]RBP91320.1 hypothetical protein DFO70_108102 [Cytobacillus firmus]TDX41520.1 hypothetical protein DFO72_108102 [Cytobacillus oceanisediminis]
MKDLPDVFIRELKAKGHLGYFLRKSNFSLLIKAGNISIPLKILNGEIRKAGHTSHFDVEIYGSEKAVLSLILGELKLRDALSQNIIKMETTFREKLLLETFFCLGKISYHNT